MTEDKIICIQCNQPFEFSIETYHQFLKKGFDIPKRCPECRKRPKRELNQSNTPLNKKSRRQNEKFDLDFKHAKNRKYSYE